MRRTGGRVWIAWEWQRRSVELARHFGCEFHAIVLDGLFRYPISILRTLRILARRPQILFVQNPSMILATLACAVGCITRTPVVVDRHSTFLLGRRYRNTPRILLFKLLHRFTLRAATLTLVTNEFLAARVRALGGRAFILPDKLPELKPTRPQAWPGGRHLLMISSCSRDEPIPEVLAAMRELSAEEIRLHISGNHRKLDESVRRAAPPNVEFTGFLPEQDFVDLLLSVRAVLALTTAKHCLLCGCYEAVAAGKPLLTSASDELREYFDGALCVENTSAAIATGIRRVVSEEAHWTRQALASRERIAAVWSRRAASLESWLQAGAPHPGPAEGPAGADGPGTGDLDAVPPPVQERTHR